MYGASIVGTTSSYAENANVNLMPGYTLTNAFASYAIDKQTTASLTVNNLFNKLAITEVQAYAAGYYSPRVAPGRAIQATLRYNF